MNNRELFPLAAEQPEAKDIKRLLLQYTRYWYWFILGAGLSLAATFLYLRYFAVPQYRVYSTLLVKDDKSGQGLSSADALSGLGTLKSSRNIENEMLVLRSQSLMERVVRELGLFTSYSVEGRVVDREIYGHALPIRLLINTLDSTAAGKSFTVHLKPGNAFTLEDNSGTTTAHSFGQQIQKPYGTFTIVATSSQPPSFSQITVRFQDIQQVASHYNQAVTIQQ
jgi:hypothetical protein